MHVRNQTCLQTQIWCANARTHVHTHTHSEEEMGIDTHNLSHRQTHTPTLTLTPHTHTHIQTEEAIEEAGTAVGESKQEYELLGRFASGMDAPLD